MQVTMTMDEYKDMNEQIEEYKKDIDDLNQEIDKLNQILKFNLIGITDRKISVTNYGGISFIPTKYEECTSLTINKSEIINYIKEKYECEVPKDFEIIIK